MNPTWRHLFIKILFWFMAEIMLNVLGLDQLADYSEFMASRNAPSHWMASTSASSAYYTQK